MWSVLWEVNRVMDIAIILIPLVISASYIILSFFRWFNKVDKKLIRRIYYFCSIIWILLIVNNSDLQIIEVTTVNNTENSPNTINNWLLGLGLFVLVIIWDVLFISCRQINKFIYKGLEVSTEEYNAVTTSVTTDVANYNCLQEIIKIQYDMFLSMEYYLSRMKNLDGGIIYKRIINTYRGKRKNINIDVYYNNENDMEEIRNQYKIDKSHFSNIYYTLNQYGFCVPQLPNIDTDFMLVVITTLFTKDNLLLVIKGGKILNNENLVLQNLISYFDRLIELQAYKEVDII